jgi:hypothetical protein
MIHKSRAYRRHQRERVIKNRTRDWLIYTEPFEDDKYPKMFSKKRPFGCGCQMCKKVRYKNSIDKVVDDLKEKDELEEIRDWYSCWMYFEGDDIDDEDGEYLYEKEMKEIRKEIERINKENEYDPHEFDDFYDDWWDYSDIVS